MTRSNWTSLFLILCLAWPLGSCSYYSTSGSLLPHIKTVAVPLFENETLEYGVREQLTDAVIDGLIEEANLKVVDVGEADSVIRGKVIEAHDEPFTYTADEKAKEYRFRLFAEVSYFDAKKNKVIWEEKALEGWGIYEASSADERERGKERAVRMLAKEIVDRTASGW